jgi:WD40 repeat protein
LCVLLVVLAPCLGQTAEPGEAPARNDLHGDPLPPGALARLGTLRLHLGMDAVLSVDGKVLFTSGGTRGLRSVDLASGKEIRRFGSRPGYPFRFALSPDGRFLALGGNGQPVRLWDVENQKERCFDDSPQNTAVLAFSQDGRTLVAHGGPKSALSLWDVVTGKLRRRFETVLNINSLHLSAHGKTLTIATRTDLRLLDAQTGKEIGRHDFKPARRFAGVWIAPDGKSLIGNADSVALRVWAADGRELRQIQDQPKGYVTAAAISLDGKLAATASQTERFIRLWNPTTGEAIRRLEGAGPFAITSLAFTPDNKRLLALNAGTLRQWDVATGEPLGQLQ